MEGCNIYTESRHVLLWLVTYVYQYETLKKEST